MENSIFIYPPYKKNKNQFLMDFTNYILFVICE